VEGRTYPAQWKKRGARYVVHLSADPAVQGTSADFDDACNELCMRIGELYGDGEAVLDLLRPSPVPEAVRPYLEPPLVTVGWNDAATGEPFQEGLYAGGWCSACDHGIGPRTEVPLRVQKLPRADVAGYAQRTSRSVLLSEGFLSRLDPPERTALAPREVLPARPAKRRYFEVTGPPRLKQVGVVDGRYWRLACDACRACGHKQFSCAHPALPPDPGLHAFVARSDLPADLDRVFLVEDTLGRSVLCMTTARWRRLKRGPDVGGALASRLLVLPEAEVDRDPDLARVAFATWQG
jgi:hypothetical protein